MAANVMDLGDSFITNRDRNQRKLNTISLDLWDSRKERDSLNIKR